ILTGLGQQVFTLPNYTPAFPDGTVTIDVNLVSQDSGDVYHTQIWPVDFAVPSQNPGVMRHFPFDTFELGYKDVLGGFDCISPPQRYDSAHNFAELRATRDSAGNWTGAYILYVPKLDNNGNVTFGDILAEQYKLTLSE